MGNGEYGNSILSKTDERNLPGRHIGYANGKKEIPLVIAEFEAEEARQQTPEYLVPLINASLENAYRVWRINPNGESLLDYFLRTGIGSNRSYTLQEVEEKYKCRFDGHKFIIKEVK
ncbi:MAG TPA: hypothetical protein DEG71_10300 [Clostridiales bacterium]|nr:hypothetical protein [Clostridiales bacterium]